MQQPEHRPAWGAMRGAATAFALALAGCASQPPAKPGTAADSPPLQLMSAGELELADGCEPRPGAVYRVNFVVQRDGRVAQVEPDHDAGCVHDALRAWVGTFEYRAPGEPVAAVVDWMGVTAARLR